MNNIEYQVFQYINNLPHSFVADFVFLLIHNLTKEGLIYYVLAAYFLIRNRDKMTRPVAMAMASGFTTYIVNDLILKNIIKRARPFEVLQGINYVPPAPDSYSMPSGQAAVAFALLTIICLTVPGRAIKIWFSLFALLVAFDRVYLGHHYPSDVFVGAIVGVVVAWVIYFLSRRIK